MARTLRLERLTASDIFLLLWDDYGWSTDIGGLAILDGTGLLDPEGRVQVEEIRLQLGPRLHLVPRFRQLLHRPRLGLGWPLWVDAPSFDLGDHIRVQPIGAPGDEARLLQVCQELARLRLDPSRPLWELWLLPGLPERRVGALLRMHHAFADGAAALAAFGALLYLNADPPTLVAPPWAPTPIPTSVELLRDNLRRRGQELGHGWSGLIHPRGTFRSARQALPAWREVLTEQPAPPTSLNRPVGAGRRLAVIRGRLDLTKRIAHTHEAKVNDVGRPGSPPRGGPHLPIRRGRGRLERSDPWRWPMPVQLNPYLSFRDNAREAMAFYQSVFGGDLTVNTFADYDASPDHSEDDKIMHAVLEAPNGIVFMASDTPNTMEYAPGRDFSMSLSGEDEAELRGYFDKLGEGGSVEMPLEQAPWGDTFGMLTDRFGVRWLVNVSKGEG